MKGSWKFPEPFIVKTQAAEQGVGRVDQPLPILIAHQICQLNFGQA